MAERNTQSFEQSMVRLNEIVNSMSGNQTSLEDSLALFAEGIRLVSSCKKKLTEAEQKVQMLISRPDGMDSLQDVVLENNHTNKAVKSQTSTQNIGNVLSNNSNSPVQNLESQRRNVELDDDEIPF